MTSKKDSVSQNLSSVALLQSCYLCSVSSVTPEQIPPVQGSSSVGDAGRVLEVAEIQGGNQWIFPLQNLFFISYFKTCIFIENLGPFYCTLEHWNKFS